MVGCDAGCERLPAFKVRTAAADTAIDASVRSSYTAFSALVADWTSSLKRWRCGLSAAERTRLGVGTNWRCGEVSFFIDRVNFEQLGPARGQQDRWGQRVAA